MNVTVEFKITKKKKKKIYCRNTKFSQEENNIPPTLLHDSPYRRANRSYSRTSNCTPPRAKIRNWRAVAERWQWWSPINRTQGGKSTSSRPEPWSAWIRPGMYDRHGVFSLTNPVVRTSLSDSAARTRKTTISLDLPHGLDLRDFCAWYSIPRGNFYSLWWWWIEQGPEVSGISKFYSDLPFVIKKYLRTIYSSNSFVIHSLDDDILLFFSNSFEVEVVYRSNASNESRFNRSRGIRSRGNIPTFLFATQLHSILIC